MPQATATSEYAELLVSKISPAADNIRSHIDPAELDDLAESIKARGLLEPLLVTPNAKGTGHEIIAGHRRHAAAKLAGLKRVPCMVRTYESDADRLVDMLTENLQRSDIDVVDEARAYERLTKDLKVKQRDLAGQVGRSQSHISKRLTLLKLPERALDDISRGHLDIGLAVDLAGITDPDVVERLLRKGVSRWDVDHELDAQRRRSIYAKGKAELDKHGLPEAPGECRYTPVVWEVMTGPLGATHGWVDTAAGGTVVWYRQRTDEEAAAERARIDAEQAAQEKEWAKEDAEEEAAQAKAEKERRATETPEQAAARAQREAEQAARQARLDLSARIDHERDEFVRDHLTGKRFDRDAAALFAADMVLTSYGVGLEEDEDAWYVNIGESDAPPKVCHLVGISVPPEGGYQAAQHAIEAYVASSPSLAKLVVATAQLWAEFGHLAVVSLSDGEGLGPADRAAQRYLEALGYKPSAEEAAELARITTVVVEEADDEAMADQDELAALGLRLTPARSVAIRVLFTFGRARIGMGMYSCTAENPIITSAGEGWLVGHGLAEKTDGEVRCTDKGRALVAVMKLEPWPSGGEPIDHGEDGVDAEAVA